MGRNENIGAAITSLTAAILLGSYYANQVDAHIPIESTKQPTHVPSVEVFYKPECFVEKDQYSILESCPENPILFRRQVISPDEVNDFLKKNPRCLATWDNKRTRQRIECYPRDFSPTRPPICPTKTPSPRPKY